MNENRSKTFRLGNRLFPQHFKRKVAIKDEPRATIPLKITACSASSTPACVSIWEEKKHNFFYICIKSKFQAKKKPENQKVICII